MQTRVTLDEMKAAARQLAKSERGRVGLQRLRELLEHEDLALGLLDRASFLALLQGMWDGHVADVRAAIDEAEKL